MKETITTRWLSDLAFEAEVDGHKVYMDSSMEHGGKNTGPRPKPLMMIALAGCTGMDVAAILKKMKVELEAFSVEVEGEITEDHPKRFEGMKVIYRVKGKNSQVCKITVATILLLVLLVFKITSRGMASIFNNPQSMLIC